MSSSSSVPGDHHHDLTVIGGGVVGLWCALMAADAGARVRLLEKRTLASGASGGMLGALMPHQPNGWTGKKQFQLNGLLTLPESLSQLESRTGMVCGYQRVGRIMPIRHAQKRAQSQHWVDGSQDNWPDGIDWSISDTHPAPGWAAHDSGAHGWNCDTLSARINPRLYMAALEKSARSHDLIAIAEHHAVETLPDGPVIIAAGTGSFALVDPDEPHRIGTGVKGQGARLQPLTRVDPASPLIYDDGIYIIAHADGTVAVGSTSENSFETGTTTDEKLDEVIARAATLCPALEGAHCIERWAGVRPKAAGRDPLVGPLNAHARTIIATGGFKITFAIAHLMARAAVGFALNDDDAGATAVGLPPSFLPHNRKTDAP